MKSGFFCLHLLSAAGITEATSLTLVVFESWFHALYSGILLPRSRVTGERESFGQVTQCIRPKGSTTLHGISDTLCLAAPLSWRLSDKLLFQPASLLRCTAWPCGKQSAPPSSVFYRWTWVRDILPHEEKPILASTQPSPTHPQGRCWC